MPIIILQIWIIIGIFYCTDVIYCVLIYYFLIYASLPSDDFFCPFRDEVYSHKAGDHYKEIKKVKGKTLLPFTFYLLP